ncbi:hypothetical protein [Pseudomonas frederiksbergensis]|uniref:hypothetical protein n=1 Tax=Pseudomonas frederiksbergensis TaxID=104087 RepID=UPI003D223953
MADWYGGLRLTQWALAASRGGGHSDCRRCCDNQRSHPLMLAQLEETVTLHRSPFVTSGLRIGTPAITTRGFGVIECEQLAGWLCDVLDALENGNSEKVGHHVREQVAELCRRHPVYR